MTHQELRKIFKKFWQNRDHQEIPPISLVPQNDPTTLFTGSGMQQLVPYLLGEPHPLGKKLYNIQPAFRAQDIENVGDNRHDTFFEMMGNWSLGTYFKEEQIPWMWEFFTKDLGLAKEKLFVSIFQGEQKIPKDEESLRIWKKIGVSDDRIFFYGSDKNWWSRAGSPSTMPAGEPGGPSSEVFYDFGKEYRYHEKSVFKTHKCQPNCDCGRFLEIGNSVFMEYKKEADGTVSELPEKNVDFGGGLERILMATNDEPDMFNTDVFKNVIEEIELDTEKKYFDYPKEMRVIADHLKAAVFIILAGVSPSNKEQGYVLRRLLRRSAVKMYQISGRLTPSFDTIIDRGVLRTYAGYQGVDRELQRKTIFEVINNEIQKFSKSLDRGLREFEKYSKTQLNALNAFNLFQSYGFPFEISRELFEQKGVSLNKSEFDRAFKTHQELSRKVITGRFKGGLADQSEQTVKYHTATHLLHQALFDILGNDVRQEGSNITGERLRFDFSSSKKSTDEDKKKVEKIINDKINEALPVNFEIMPKEEAEKIGAKSFFREKYPEKVKVYYISKTNSLNDSYSKEFCGGPHIKNTKEIGKIEIYKLEKIGSNMYRIYAK